MTDAAIAFAPGAWLKNKGSDHVVTLVALLDTDRSVALWLCRTVQGMDGHEGVLILSEHTLRSCWELRSWGGSLEKTETLGYLPLDLVEAHDAHMARAPIEYRGYLIKPTSMKWAPHYTSRWHFWGFNVCDLSGSTNMAPGAVWSRSIGDAKSLIDCLHEADTPPAVYADRVQWNDRFWALVRERRTGHDL